MTNDEGVLDPWVAEYFEADPSRNTVMDTLDPEILELARGDFSLPCDVEIKSIENADVEGIPIRIYRDEEPPTGLVVYFHGGGFVLGSIGIMENVAKELCHASGAVVISVGYRARAGRSVPRGPRRLREGDALGDRERDDVRRACVEGGDRGRERRRQPLGCARVASPRRG